MPGQGLPQPGGEQRSQTKFIVFENFEKMNTQSARQSLSEKELAWLENLQPIAPNNLLTVPAPAALALATLAETLVLIFYVSIGGVDYFICFSTAGSAYAITIATGMVNQFAIDGTFSTAPDVTTWQASRVLINDSHRWLLHVRRHAVRAAGRCVAEYHGDGTGRLRHCADRDHHRRFRSWRDSHCDPDRAIRHRDSTDKSRCRLCGWRHVDGHNLGAARLRCYRHRDHEQVGGYQSNGCYTWIMD